MRKLITKAELADELGVSRPRVSQYVRDGLPVRPDGRVDLIAACRWLRDHLDPFNGDFGSRAYRAAREILLYEFDDA